MFRRLSVTSVCGRRFFSNQKVHQDIVDNYVKLSTPERISRVFSSAFGAFQDPTKADLVSALGDLTAYNALLNLRDKMLNDETGRQILQDKPRIGPNTINMEELKNLGPNKFGRKYYEFMEGHGFKAEERPLVKYVPDYELAYILQRYKEIHDFLHVLLNYDVSVENELAVKWFEMIQLGLPSTALSAFVGPFILARAERTRLLVDNISDMIQNAKRCPLILNVYWEKEMETDVDVLRERLGIIPLK